jgi:hypothetical protein
MSLKPGMPVEMKSDSPYVLSHPGTKWMVYQITSLGRLLLGPIPGEDSSFEKMRTRYVLSKRANWHRIEDKLVFVTVESEYCMPLAKNSMFKNLLSQEKDIWKEKKKLKKPEGIEFKAIYNRQGRRQFVRVTEEDEDFLSNSDLPF